MNVTKKTRSFERVFYWIYLFSSCILSFSAYIFLSALRKRSRSVVLPTSSEYSYPTAMLTSCSFCDCLNDSIMISISFGEMFFSIAANSSPPSLPHLLSSGSSPEIIRAKLSKILSPVLSAPVTAGIMENMAGRVATLRFSVMRQK